MSISIGKKIAGVALAGAIAVGAGAAAFAADGSGTSPTTLATAAGISGKASGAKAAGGKVRGAAILRRADHGDIEVQVKGADGATPAWQTVTFDKGQVGDVGADHITLSRPDGQSVTLKIDATTKFHGVTTWQEVQKSKGAIVVSKNSVATQILQAK